MMNPKLDQRITVTEQGDRLGAVLERLSEKTGVKLRAEKTLANLRVVVRYEGNLRGLMNAFAHFYAISKTSEIYWLSGEKDGERDYFLMRDKSAKEELESLRKERETLLATAMDQAVAGGNRFVRHLAHLSDADRRTLYAGGSRTFPAGHLGGREFLAEVLVRDAENWSDDTEVTYRMAGASPLTRMLRRTFTDPENGNTAEEGFALAQFCPALAPERQQVEWRLQYGDPAPEGGGKNMAPPGNHATTTGTTPRRSHLMEIALWHGVNLIADDAGQEIRTLVPSRTVSAALDAACAFQWGSGLEADSNHGSFWRFAAGTYLVRSIGWPEEEG